MAESKINVKKVSIRCPSCGYENLFQRTGDGEKFTNKQKETVYSDEVIEARCSNNDCKLEFISEIKPTEREDLFLKYVLERGFKERIWDLDRIIIVGTKATKHLGVDFMLYGAKGGVLWIEFKYAKEFEFTREQISRFTFSIDKPYVANRFIGLTFRKQRPEKINLLAYWTPNFFRNLPQEKAPNRKINYIPFIPIPANENIYRFGFYGLDQYIRTNSFGAFNQFKKEYEEDEIIKHPNLTIMGLKRGILGKVGSEFETFSVEGAFEIIYLKLKHTIQHLNEDSDIQRNLNDLPKYQRFGIEKTEAENTEGYITKIILEIISKNYRPVFAIDVRDELLNDPSIRGYITRLNNKFFVGKRDLFLIVHNKLRDLSTRGDIVQFKVSDERKWKYSYGIEGHKNILLAYLPSQLLDELRQMYLFKIENKMTNPYCTSLTEIETILGIKYSTSLRRFQNGIKPLFTQGLVEKYATMSKICLSKKGLEYISMIGQFL